MTDFVSYVHSPSVNVAFLNPVARNIRDVCFNLRIFQIQLWHSTVVAEALEVWDLPPFPLRRQFVDKIPVQIFWFFPLFQYILKCKKFSSCVVVYRIQNYLHAALMSFLYELLEILCCSKWRVNLIIINGIIFMARIWLKDRCQIHHIDSQIFHIIHMLYDSSEIAMQIIHRRNRCLIPQLFVHRLCCGKAWRKNLIHNLVGCPLWHLKHFFLPEVLWAIKHSVPVCNALLVKLIIAVIYLFAMHVRKFKKVSQTYQMHLKLRFIIIVKLRGSYLLHGKRHSRILALHRYILVLIVEDYLLHIILFYLHADHK